MFERFISNFAEVTERERLSASAIQAYASVVEKWTLTKVQAWGLLGVDGTACGRPKGVTSAP